jgi:hypothetical protein
LELEKMRYLLRTALAALLTLICSGTTFAQTFTATTQFVPGTATQVASSNFNSALVLSSLTIYPGALLDLTNGGMVVDAANVTYYAPNGSGGYSAETGPQALNDALANITGGNILNPPYGQSNVNAPGAITGDGTSGITSTTPPANGSITVGVGLISQANAQYNTWRGVNLNSSVVTGMTDPTLVGYAYAGDLFLEGYSDPSDLGTVASNIVANDTGTSWEDGDYNYEGYSDPSDLGSIASNIVANPTALYQVPSGIGSVVAPPKSGVATVPEPSSLVLALTSLSFVALTLRRRVRS